mmetsp:Transcript_20838/g.29414  ORF Transcript_20838/g.29414 Transcript_20838/m.29414 type:complete len:338 (-) Transcript_20838:146-1159(-)
MEEINESTKPVIANDVVTDEKVFPLDTNVKAGDNATTTKISWPVKTRDFHDHHFDSTMWDNFKFRDDDVIISTYGKSGTTWMQQILCQMIFDGDGDICTSDISPWVDLRLPPKEVKLPAIEAQTHRRFLKTHLPVDALNFSPKAKYIYVGRDARDIAWSFYNHHSKANDAWYNALNKTPGLVGPEIEKPPECIKQYWTQWFENNGAPYHSFWENMSSWWAIRDLPNVMFVHFNDLKKDMPSEMRRVAKFLDIQINEDKWDDIVEHCTFNWMKANASKVAPVGGIFWEGGAETFINQGTNGRWTDVLTEEECQVYEAKAIEMLGEECAAWLKHGGVDS